MGTSVQTGGSGLGGLGARGGGGGGGVGRVGERGRGVLRGGWGVGGWGALAGEGGEFLNRDLSWLEFNRRVLHEALDDRTPLLERVRFLQIFTSNLDEYFMKRVGGLKRQVAGGMVAPPPDGLTPAQSIAAIRNAVVPMLRQQAECYTRTLVPGLAA